MHVNSLGYQIIMISWGTSVGGVMVSIDAFQALDPGSIPGHRSLLLMYIP